MQLESILSFGVAAIAVIVAIWSALEARTANRKAAEANRISKEALDLQRLHSPAPWSELQKSERTIIKLQTSQEEIFKSWKFYLIQWKPLDYCLLRTFRFLYPMEIATS